MVHGWLGNEPEIIGKSSSQHGGLGEEGKGASCRLSITVGKDVF